MKVNEWAANNSENKFYLRPYMVASDASKKETSGIQEDMEIGIHGFCGNSGEDDNWCEVLGSSKQFSQSFLYVHQASWQNRLLECYENTMCLLDATYKTTRYDLVLFFVCVRTNVGYIVVAEFITQQEDAEHISEALRQLQFWNPTWKPDFFMTDYSEAERLAIEQCFSGV